jgi:hypothetical protein
VPPNRATLGVFGECARRGPPFRGCDVVVGGAEVSKKGWCPASCLASVGCPTPVSDPSAG